MAMTNEEVLNRIHEVNYEMFLELDRICRENQIEYYFACGTLLGAVRYGGFIPWDNDVDIWITRENFAKLYAHRNDLRSDFEMVMPEDHGERKYLDCVPRINYKHIYIKMDADACRFYNNRNNRIDLDIFFLDKTYDNLRGRLQRAEIKLLYGLLNAYRHKSINQDYPPLLKIISAAICLVGRCFPLSFLRKRVEAVATRYNHAEDANYYFLSNDSRIALKKLVPVEACGSPKYLDFEGSKAPVPQDYDTVLKIWFGDYMQLPPESERVPHWGRILIAPENFVFEDPPEQMAE